MPRKKDPTKQAARRSHHGCQRCRLQKIRCDEAKPRCGPCCSRGYTNCTYFVKLKWEADYRHIGRAFGRSGIWSKASNSNQGGKTPRSDSSKSPTPQPPLLHQGRLVHIYPSSFLNLFTHDFQDSDEDSTGLIPLNHGSVLQIAEPAAQALAEESSLLTLNLGDPSLGKLRLVDQHLISYYLYRICPLTVPCADSSSQSPFSAILFPFALSCSSLGILQALAGLSALHRSRFEEGLQPVAWRYSAKALRSLRTLLSTIPPDETAENPEVLALMMLLCQIELTKDGNSSWVVHLRGARNLIRQQRQKLHGNLLEQSQQSIVRRDQDPWEQINTFATRFFAYCDVMGRTACGEEPCFGNDFWANQDDEVDPWMGCSPHLVKIISMITEFSWKYRLRNESRSETDELKQKRDELDTLLSQQHLEVTKSAVGDDSLTMQLSVQLKHLTVGLYLQAALGDTSPCTKAIREKVQTILRLVSVLLSLGVKAGLTWPLFMAACQLDPSEELEMPDDVCFDDSVPRFARPFVLYALGQLTDSLSNVCRTRQVIEQVWKKREESYLTASNRHNDSPAQAYNDWTQYVAPLCHNISVV